MEISTTEPLYYTAIKCRHPSLRRRALELMKLARGVGVWDGDAMAVIASHVIDLEEGPIAGNACVAARGTRYRDFEQYLDSVHEFVGLDDPISTTSSSDDGAKARQINLVSEVAFKSNIQKRSVEVDCGWFSEEKRTWKHRVTVLSW
ncbi:hypothetical protein K505DRAFT_330776 [Melanomma pulvis-pyrius CBS 109.77]|uniref:Uncharacterized protein n=1 Tax=Melanomma pulvis-pyrius CBS 109.77 TaxID=1314802 RepID=A0A6A6WPN8_9PLEO|nr:hypothetical protein K505DRAFT_330776 [Melanomma pulvis-pyrius CBS 109.77]